VQAPERAAGGQQLVVGALLHDASVVEHHDVAGAADRGQPVGDDDGRAPRQEAAQALLDPRFQPTERRGVDVTDSVSQDDATACPGQCCAA
jgi:hypothetical protein